MVVLIMCIKIDITVFKGQYNSSTEYNTFYQIEEDDTGYCMYELDYDLFLVDRKS